MTDLQVQRWEYQRATAEMYSADVWLEDTKLALDAISSQCKEWRDKPELEQWCVTVRAEAASAIEAIEKLQAAIEQKP